MNKAKTKTQTPLSEVMADLQAGVLGPLADIYNCTIESPAADVLALELMLKQMRRRHLYTFVEVRTPAERETAWKKAERCQAGLYLLTNDEKYNTIEQYA